MRNRIYLEQSSGSTVVIKEYTTSDLLPIPYILRHTKKEALALYKNPEHVGRKYKKVADTVGRRIFNHFLFLLVSRLMEEERLIFKTESEGPILSIFIGNAKKNPEKVGKRKKKNKICFATLGKRYAVILHGIEHDYYFRMPYRRRKELSDRLKAGQMFYNQLKEEGYVQAL